MNCVFVMTGIVAFLLHHSTSYADFFVENFALTDSSVSFDISGTLAGPQPEAGLEDLFFVNSTFAAPGFTPLPGGAIDFSWTGSQALGNSFTGNPLFGDYFFLEFSENLAVGDSLSGTFSAEFAAGTFDVSEVDSINVIWGFAADFANRTFHDEDFLGGTLQTTFAIPEPGSFLTLIIVGPSRLGSSF